MNPYIIILFNGTYRHSVVRITGDSSFIGAFMKMLCGIGLLLSVATTGTGQAADSRSRRDDARQETPSSNDTKTTVVKKAPAAPVPGGIPKDALTEKSGALRPAFAQPEPRDRRPASSNRRSESGRSETDPRNSDRTTTRDSSIPLPNHPATNRQADGSEYSGPETKLKELRNDRQRTRNDCKTELGEHLKLSRMYKRQIDLLGKELDALAPELEQEAKPVPQVKTKKPDTSEKENLLRRKVLRQRPCETNLKSARQLNTMYKQQVKLMESTLKELKK